MRPKIQAQARARTANELTSARTTQIFGLAMTAIFVAMLILNAISY
jgi:orotate phosphoribosyltransferase